MRTSTFISRTITLLLLLFLVACTSNTEILLDKIDAYSLVNPETRRILKDGGVVDATILKGNKIIIQTYNQIVTSDDLFQTFTFQTKKNFLNFNNLSPFTDEAVIIHNINVDLSVQFFKRNGDVSETNVSTCNCWASSNPFWSRPGRPGVLRNAFFLSPTEGWILNNKDDGIMALERFNGSESQELLVFPFNEGRIHFFNKNRGYLFLTNTYLQHHQFYPSDVYLSITTDGGQTWSQPRLLDVQFNITKIKTLSQNELMILSDFTPNEIYYSSNAGNSWKLITFESNSEVEHMVSPAFIITRRNNSFYIYNGVTQQVVRELQHPIIYYGEVSVRFYDEKNGIVFNPHEMHVTTDGGNTWKKLMYPYPYLTK